MKFFIILSLIAVAVCEEYYSAEYDGVDIEGIVSNNDSLKAFYECYADKGPCNAAGVYFKKFLPEAFVQACAKCTPTQKHILRRFLEELERKFPAEFADFKSKYDARGEYYNNLEAAVANA